MTISKRKSVQEQPNKVTEKSKKNAEAAAKRGAKDSVFCDLFGIPEYTLELYRVLHPEDTAAAVEDIGNTKLRNVLVDRMYNDLGFTVRDRVLIMIEAQSTWSINILIRIFLYLAETWKEYIITTRQYQYGRKKLILPIPELYVLYTGNENVENVYSLAEEFFDGHAGVPDVSVNVLHGGMTENDILSQYVKFTRVFDGEVRKHGYSKETILRVISICRDEDILREYLQSREREVIDIMMTLYDPEYLIDAYGKYERDEGRTEGRAEGVAEGIAEGKAAYVIRFIQNGWNIDRIADFLGETPETIRAMLPKEYSDNVLSD